MAKFAAPPIRTGFIGNPPKTLIAEVQNVPAYAWTNWFQNVSTALSTVSPPATSSSPGIAGQRAFDSNFEYVCIAANSWKRIPLNAF